MTLLLIRSTGFTVGGQEIQNPKSKRLQLDRAQVGVLFAFVCVGFVLAFGAGFITGMWYQTHDQYRPLALDPEPQTPVDKSDENLTFYSTLTHSDTSTDSQIKPNSRGIQQRTTPEPSALSSQMATTATRQLTDQQFSIQVGSFRARDEAENLHKLLANKGYKTVVKTALVPGKGILYRVRVGQFAERETARRVANRLRSEERLAAMITVITP